MEAFSKRISANRAKVNQHKGVPGMEAEVSRLEEAIRAVRERENIGVRGTKTDHYVGRTGTP